MTYIEMYDQLQREAQLQDGCMKITGGHSSTTMHLCGRPRVTPMYCNLHRFGV